MTLDTQISCLAAPVSGLEIIEQINAGKIGPDEAFAGFADAYDSKEDTLSCFVSADYSKAAERAGNGPLRGLPVGIKDILETNDFPTRHGSPIYADHVPLGDASAVALARKAGGAIVGKTVTTEFAYFTPRGTKNPWNPEYSPGGSSSGSAAGVAAGMFPYAIGSQTGGSVIRPASYCGVAGYKPTYGLIPTQGAKPFSHSLDTLGVFAATVPDCAFFASMLTERELESPQAPTPPVIGFCPTSQWEHVSEEMRDAMDTAMEKARAAGATVVEHDLPSIFMRAVEAHSVIQNYEAVRALAWEWANHRDKLSHKLVETLEESETISPESYDAARRVAKAARLALSGVFQNVDVLLTPSSEGHAPKDLTSTGTPTFNKLWTLMGTPCVNVPGLFATNGMPLGVQIVGAAMTDRQTLQASAWLEKALAE
ncbi:MAG: amidase [Tepidamorphaceae bacterium]